MLLVFAFSSHLLGSEIYSTPMFYYPKNEKPTLKASSPRLNTSLPHFLPWSTQPLSKTKFSNMCDVHTSLKSFMQVATLGKPSLLMFYCMNLNVNSCSFVALQSLEFHNIFQPCGPIPLIWNMSIVLCEPP